MANSGIEIGVPSVEVPLTLTTGATWLVNVLVKRKNTS